MAANLQATLDHVDNTLDASLDRLFAMLRVPSISTDPAYAETCAKTAETLAADLRSMGFDAEPRKTPLHPIVVAHDKDAAPEGSPHVLFYGHYDVQPVDPIELWESDPFEPQIVTREDGTKFIRARGANDDKGQLMTLIEAVRAWKEVNGPLPFKLSMIIEGEEETSSPSLVPFLKENHDELAVDLALICDTSQWDRDTPAITTSLRGMVKFEMTVKAADRDLHSGMFGGAAANPLHVLSNVIASLRDDEGRVVVPHFYDNVPEIPDEIKTQWDGLGFSTEKFLGEVDLSVPAGEKAYSTLEQIWARPTLEVNGMWGGYTGDGFKTVIASEAHAKISCRLVGKQNPQVVYDNLTAFIRSKLPADVSVEFKDAGADFASVMDTGRDEFENARQALTEEWGKEAAFVGSGGSIPIAGHFKTILGMDSILVGFGLDDDRIHSPNEKYEMQSFHKGIRSWVRIIDKLANH